MTAAEVMTRGPVTIGPEEPVERAAFLMYDHAVKRLPVVDSAGHLAGIISRGDVLSVYAKPDEEIRREIREEVLLRDFLVDPGRLGIVVEDGVVTVSGRPETDELGRQIIAAVRHVDGVVAVRDHLPIPVSARWRCPDTPVPRELGAGTHQPGPGPGLMSYLLLVTRWGGARHRGSGRCSTAHSG